jgi:hypothetical protein
MIKDLIALKELTELIKQDIIANSNIQAEIKLEVLNQCINTIIEKQESILE